MRFKNTGTFTSQTEAPQLVYALEADFSDFGYKISFCNLTSINGFERSLLYSYLQSPGNALLYMGVCNAPKMAIAPSIVKLQAIAKTFFRFVIAFNSNNPEGSVSSLMLEFSEQPSFFVRKIIGLLRPENPTVNFDDISEKSVLEMFSMFISAFSSFSVDAEKEGDSLSKRISDISTEMWQTTICFSLSENTRKPDYPVTVSITCGLGSAEKFVSDALSHMENKRLKDSLLYTLKTLAKQSKLIKRVYNDGKVLGKLNMTTSGLLTFLRELELYQSYGIVCRIPSQWKKKRVKFGISATIGNSGSGLLAADSLLSFNMSLCIDGQALSDEEMQSILDAYKTKKDALFLFRGNWVEISKKDIENVLLAYNSFTESYDDGISVSEAFSAFMSPETIIPSGLSDSSVSIQMGKWLRDISESLSSPRMLPEVDLSAGDFRAVLRPYQVSGVSWLMLMNKLGLGACLSDDMGLGKTVQVIAVLEYLRIHNKKPSLVVIPASLLQNWKNELERFAPKLKYCVLHNSIGSVSFDVNDKVDLYITTYSMVARLPKLMQLHWECLIIDEAQAIKNPATQQSKAIKKLSAKFKIAMTGTPVENSPLDLWSIFNFLNPGLLGSSRTFCNAVSEPDAYSTRTKKLVEPFILRRLKTDKSIIADLPEKIEMKCYCSLKKEQAVLYKTMVDSMSGDLSGSYGIERRGLVLSGILRLKQICNHPDQFTGGKLYIPSESGKTERLIELCEHIKEVNEKVLVFTQFKELCEPLWRILYNVFGKSGLMIHGGTSIKERGKIVDSFNALDSDIPYIILSLKAGGIGLNLTAANHVIHFDRWWNPAVENQATDRAFRIGQAKNCIVHKLICSGTLEERIDELIEGKRNLSDALIGVQSKLTEMSDKELLDLISLSEQTEM